MKKSHIFILTAMSAMTLLCSCSEDRDDNPTIKTPTDFVLNTPAYSEMASVLTADNSLYFSWSQPDYGFPVSASYNMQFSSTGEFKDAEYDEEGNLTAAATYFALESSVTNVYQYTSSAEIDKGILILNGWTKEENVPSTPVDIYARCSSTIAETSNTIYSNIVKLKVVPFFQETAAAEPAPWYLIGSCIGDGTWTNSALGTSIFPMDIDPDASYDSKGNGVFTYTGYFLDTDIFKIIGEVGSWGLQVGNSGSDGIDNIVFNDGGSSNLSVPATGWYTITLDSKNQTCKVEAASISASAYPQMMITGDFDGWGTSILMTSCNPNNVNNHMWYYELDASAGDTTCKFLTDSSWAVNWGAEGFPYGTGVQNGANIPVSAGNWIVFFNDLTGKYQFIAK